MTIKKKKMSSDMISVPDLKIRQRRGGVVAGGLPR